MSLKIFYAWQMDRSTKLNRWFIQDAAKEAIKSLRVDLRVEDAPAFDDAERNVADAPEYIELDHDTKDEPGTPHIAETILRKIKACGIFLADVSLVAETQTADGRSKALPNPNVMIELGAAISSVGWERIILVMNTAFGSPDALPFDLKHRSFPITYDLARSDDPLKAATRKQLARAIADKVKTIRDKVLGSLVVGREAQWERATAILREFNPQDTLVAKPKTLMWFSLSGDDEPAEFYAVYETAKGGRCVDLFTTRGPRVERLFHQRDNYLEPCHAHYGGRDCFVCWWKAGSGGYLGFVIYEWDGKSLRIAYKAKDSLLYGNLAVVEGKILVSGNNQKFQLEYDGSKFRLRRYPSRLVYPDYRGSASHVLSYDVRWGSLKLTFDGVPLIFRKVEDNKFVTNEPVVIHLSDEIVVDDNLHRPQQIRLLLEDEILNYLPGFYNSYKPRMCGSTVLEINHNYGKWYKIEVVVNESGLPEYRMPGEET